MTTEILKSDCITVIIIIIIELSLCYCFLSKFVLLVRSGILAGLLSGSALFRILANEFNWTCKIRDKSDRINYRGLSFFSTTYIILPNILLSGLMSYEYVGKLTVDHQCVFRGNRTSSDHTHILCVVKNLRKKWGKIGSVLQLHRLRGSLWHN